MKLRRLFCFIMSLAIIMCGVPVSQAEKSDILNASFNVQEKNGERIKSYLVKRGIPMKDGLLKEGEALEVYDVTGGRVVPAYTRITEKYESGYAKWILVAIAPDLAPFETREYIVRKGNGSDKKTVKYKEILSSKIVVDNGVYTATIDTMGLAQINYNDTDIFSEKGSISVSEENGEEKRFKTGGKIEITEYGGIFIEIKTSNEYENSVMRIEKIYTIVGGSDSIGCISRNVAHNGPITYEANSTSYCNIDSLYDKFYFTDEFSDFSYSSETLKRKNNTIYSCDYIKTYNKSKGIGVAIATKDVEKFRGAIVAPPDVCNGFYWDKSEKSLIFAPILYKKNCANKWLDGYSKSVHYDIVLYKNKNQSLDGRIKTMKNTPWVNVDAQQFIDAGIIETTNISPLARQQHDEIRWLKGRLYGTFLAGIMPYTLNSYKNTISGQQISLGEIYYNTWFGAIVSGDGDIYDVVNEGTESWADIVPYRGVVKEARGAGRYNLEKINPANHPFYNEFSNLYIGYLMTGNNYFKESCYLMADYVHRNSLKVELGGFHTTPSVTWRYGFARTANYDETRFNFMIRAMRNAYKLFREERFAYTADQISGWLALCQEEDGAWLQFYDTNGEYFDLMNTPKALCKNYIMLYSSRGYADYYKQTKSPLMLKTLTKFADYLINELNEDGWMYNPCSEHPDRNITNEDGGRGKSPQQEIMASEIFETMYGATGDIKYLKAFCDVLRSYYSSCYKNGFAVMNYARPEKELGDGLISYVQCGQTMTLMRMDNVYTKLLYDNEKLVRAMGFDDLLIAFSPTAKYMEEDVYADYDHLEVMTHLYEDIDGKRVLFLANNSGKNSGEWKKTLRVHVKNAGIWTNTTNIIQSSLETIIGHEMDFFSDASCIELPLRLKTITGKELIVINAKYTDEEISFDAQAENGVFVFEITDKSYNNITVTGDKIKHISINKSGTVANDIVLDFGGKSADVINRWIKDDASLLINCGVLEENAEELMDIDGQASAESFCTMLLKAAKIKAISPIQKALELGLITNENITKPLTREDAADILYKTISVCTDLSKNPVTVESFKTVRDIADDKEAVEKDTQYLTFESNVIRGDMRLPKEGAYGSKISWHSSDENIVTSEGMVTLPAEEDKEVILIATFTRGNESVSKEYRFIVKKASEVYWQAGADFTNIHRIQAINDEVGFRIEATPSADIVDMMMGLCSSENTASTYSSFNLKFRFNPSGYIDAHNATEYMAVDSVKYKKDMKYTFDINVRFKECKFDITVTDEQGNENIIAHDFGFSTNAPSVTYLDGIAAIATGGEAGTITHCSNAYPGSNGTYGLDDRDMYFEITTKDTVISKKAGYTYYSSDASVISADGRFVGTPLYDKNIYIMGIPKKAIAIKDLNMVDAEKFVSVINAVYLGLISGSDNGFFDPKGILTNAQAIKLVRNVYAALPHIPILLQ